MEILHTLGELIADLGRLGYELVALGWRYILLIVWVAWWLWGVNWKRTWPVLPSINSGTTCMRRSAPSPVSRTRPSSR